MVSEPASRRLVRFTIRMTPTMKRRIERFTRELGLPYESDFILQAVSVYVDRMIALRGEAHVEIPEELRRREATASHGPAAAPRRFPRR